MQGALLEATLQEGTLLEGTLLERSLLECTLLEGIRLECTPCYYHLLHLLASLVPVARPCSSSPAGLAVSSGIDRRCACGFALWRGLGGPQNRLRKVKLGSAEDTTCVQQAHVAHARVKRELTYKLFLVDDSHMKS